LLDLPVFFFQFYLLFLQPFKQDGGEVAVRYGEVTIITCSDQLWKLCLYFLSDQSDLRTGGVGLLIFEGIANRMDFSELIEGMGFEGVDVFFESVVGQCIERSCLLFIA